MVEWPSLMQLESAFMEVFMYLMVLMAVNMPPSMAAQLFGIIPADNSICV